MLYGSTVEKTKWTPYRSVVAEVGRTMSGNVVFRVGRENDEGWSQTEHVVMTSEEAALFAREVEAASRPLPEPALPA